MSLDKNIEEESSFSPALLLSLVGRKGIGGAAEPIVGGPDSLCRFKLLGSGG